MVSTEEGFKPWTLVFECICSNHHTDEGRLGSQPSQCFKQRLHRVWGFCSTLRLLTQTFTQSSGSPLRRFSNSTEDKDSLKTGQLTLEMVLKPHVTSATSLRQSIFCGDAVLRSVPVSLSAFIIRMGYQCFCTVYIPIRIPWNSWKFSLIFPGLRNSWNLIYPATSGEI